MKTMKLVRGWTVTTDATWSRVFALFALNSAILYTCWLVLHIMLGLGMPVVWLSAACLILAFNAKRINVTVETGGAE